MKRRNYDGSYNAAQPESLHESVNELLNSVVVSTEEESKNVRSSALYADLDSRKIYAVLDDQSIAEVCDMVSVIDVYKNLDTQDVRLKLRHSTSYCNSEFEVSLKKLLKGSISATFAEKGIYVRPQFAAQLSEYLNGLMEAYIEKHGMHYVHYRLGWGKGYNLSSGYFASKSIGAPYHSDLVNNAQHILGPNGDRSVYDDMINTEVIPNKSLHLPLTLAFTAPVVPLMYAKSGAQVLMTNFAGKSTTGKSTSIALIASVWGIGAVSNHVHAIAKTFSQTQNAFEASVKNNYGFPVMFDDYSNTPIQVNFGKLIYDLASGESKGRLNSKGTLKGTFSWRTFIGMSGEHSIFELTGERTGLKPRIIEFRNIPFTASKQNSINITKVVGKHYGFLGAEFVEKLQTLTQEDLDRYYDESETVLANLLKGADNIGDRILTRLTLIRMTGALVRDLMGLAIDVDYVTDVLVKNELDRREDLSMEEKAMDTLIQYVTTNLPKFVKNDTRTDTITTPSSEIMGRIYKQGNRNIVAILPTYFRKALADFSDHETILEKWKADKLLLTNKGKTYQKTIRITGYLTKSPKVYAFVLGGDEELTKILEKEDNPNILNDLEQDDKINRVKCKPEKTIVLKDKKTQENKTYALLKTPQTIIKKNGQQYVLVDPPEYGETIGLRSYISIAESSKIDDMPRLPIESTLITEPPTVPNYTVPDDVIDAIFTDDDESEGYVEDDE